MKKIVLVASLALSSALPAGCSQGGVSASIPNGLAAASAGSVLAPQPHYAPTIPAARAISPLSVYIPYHPGGIIIAQPKFYLIFWGYKKYGDPDKLQPLLESYTQSMGGSSHNNIETQYYQTIDGKTTYIANPSNQYGGSWLDNAPIPKSPSDPDVAAQALKGVAHFGYNANGVYVVMTAHGHSEADFGTNWCSYHSNTYYGKKLVPYANLPYMPDAPAGKCGANSIQPPSDESGIDEGMTIFAGHEYGESITDPDPYTAWYGVQGEIGDYCIAQDIQNDPFGSKSYTMQPMVSDATEACVQSYSPS